MCLLFVFVLLTLTFSSIRDLAIVASSLRKISEIYFVSLTIPTVIHVYMYVAEIWVEDGNLVHSGPKQNHEVLELGP